MNITKLIETSLTSSTVTASSLPEYDSGTLFHLDYEVKVSYESDGTTPLRIVSEYKSLDNSNVGKYPPDNPDKWRDLGASNKYRMFDDYTNTQTENTTSITVVLDSSNTSTIGLFNIEGTNITFTLTHDSVVKKTETISLINYLGIGWWGYFTQDSVSKPDVLWTYPKYTSSSLEITIETYTGETVKCGLVAYGNSLEVGETQYSSTMGIRDYSIKTVDTLGRYYLQQGNYAKKNDLSVWVDNSQINSVFSALSSIRGTPAIFSANQYGTDFYGMLIYGFLSEFLITVEGTYTSRYTLEVEGLI